jgi:hypothetical protein
MQSRSMDSVISDLPALKRWCDEIVTRIVSRGEF